MNQLLDKLAWPLGIILIIALFVGAYFLLNRASPNSAVASNEEVVVDVAGAVSQPGVYRFASGVIVEDAIVAAGGLTESADLTLMAKTVNRAAELNNHDKIYIPSLTSAEAVAHPTTPSLDGLINLNTASAGLLQTLPGIGPVTAGRIIDYREQHGLFKNIAEITKVEGISTNKYNTLKSLITI